MALKKLKSVFDDISKFKNLNQSMHINEDKTHHAHHSLLDNINKNEQYTNLQHSAHIADKDLNHQHDHSFLDPDQVKKFKNLDKSMHIAEDKSHHKDHTQLDLDGETLKIPNQVKNFTSKNTYSDQLSRNGNSLQRPDPEPINPPWWTQDTSDWNIDGTPTFETTPLSEVYLTFSNPSQSDLETSRVDAGGGFNFNMNPLLSAAVSGDLSGINLDDVFNVSNMKVMRSGEFGDASLYYIDSVMGDTLALDATINKFGKLQSNINNVTDNLGLPGLKIPTLNIFGQINDLNPFDNKDLIYQNQVYELFNSNAPEYADDSLDQTGDFFGVPQYANPYRGVAFQALGIRNISGRRSPDLSYQGQVVNTTELDIRNPIAAWKSGDIKFKPIQLPNIDIDLPGFSNLDIDLPKFDFPPLNFPNISLPNINFPNIDFPDINFPNLSLPNIDFSGLSLPKFNLKNPFAGAEFEWIGPDFSGLLESVNQMVQKLKMLEFPNLPHISGWGFPLKFPKLDLPKINFDLPDLDFSKVGAALQDAGDFIAGTASKVGSALGKAADAISSAVAPVGQFLSKIKVSPFKMGGEADWGKFEVSNLGNLNPIAGIELPSLKLQNPFNVNQTDFGGVGKLVGNNPRHPKLAEVIAAKKKLRPGQSGQIISKNAQVVQPYSQLGQTRFEDNKYKYYPEVIAGEHTYGSDPHTVTKMQPRTLGLVNIAQGQGPATNMIEHQSYGMPFYFMDLRDNTYITFRAYIEALTEQLSPSWSTQNYVGRSEPTYIYERTERSIDFTLKLFAGTANELDRIYSKLRRLTSLCYPEYKPDAIMTAGGLMGMWNSTNSNLNPYSGVSQYGSKVRMKPPMTRLRIGELYGRHSTYLENQEMPSKNDVLGFMKSLSYSVPDTSPWEHRDGQRVPKHIVATISYQVLHDQPPNKDTSFYGFAGDNAV